MKLLPFLVVTPCLLLTAAAAGDPPEPVSFTAVTSDGLLGAPANQVRTAVLTGGYTLRRINCTGSLTSLVSTTWRTDARIRITAPAGQTTTFQPFATGTTFSTLPFTTTIEFPAVSDPAGEWTFRFYEGLDDGAVAVADARWNITLSFSDLPPTPPEATDLGTIFAAGATTSVSVPRDSMQWFTFVVPRLASSFRGTFLDIDTVGTTIIAPEGSGTFPDDSEVGLYNSAGHLVAHDDDDGPGFTSALSFGAGTRPAPVGGTAFDGRDGTLPAGRYYLAVGPHNLTFHPTLWTVRANSTQSGTVRINLRSNMTVTPPCAADFNGNGIPNSQDFFDFLAAFFSQNPASDFNTDLVINSQDFFDFLTAFFVGC